MRDETIAIHGGYTPDSTNAVAVPIYQTVAHEFEDADHAAAVFDMDIPGFHYNRLNNPTNQVLESRLAALERGVGALTLSSGTAAVLYSVQNIAEIGDNIVSTPQLYGTTYTMFVHILPSQGLEVRLAADDSPAALEPLIDTRTKAIFCESIGNPAGNVVDIEAVAALAHSHGIPLVVDNTIATPMMLKPIEHGADIVVHSLTKFIAGHGTTLAGAIVDSGKFPWAEHPDRFPMFSRPEPSFHGVVYPERFGEAAYIVRCRTVGLRNAGATLSPFSAFLVLQGLETMSVRLDRHEANAVGSCGVPRRRSACRVGGLCRLCRASPSRASPAIPQRALLLALHLRRGRRLRGRAEVLQRRETLQAPREPRRCKVAREPSRLDHP